MLASQFIKKIIEVSVIFVIIVLMITNFGCTKKRTPNEQLTVKRIAPYCLMLEDYKLVNMYYPDSWNDLLTWKSASMPINPYTGKPMIALASREFDPAVSPGNIYYLRVLQDDNVINCQVIIFGERGEIQRYQHSNPIVPKNKK